MARDNVSEELLQLRKRARRRLIGAIALAIFALIVLWTVLDGEPPAALTHPVEIIASVPSTSANASQLAAIVLPTPVPIVIPSPEPAGVTVLPGKLINSQIEQPTRAPSNVPNVEKLNPTRKPTDKPIERMPEKPIAKPSRDPQRILEGLDEVDNKPVEKSVVVNRGERNLVQIGAYSDKAKAAQILIKLKANGFAAYAEPVANKGVSLTRIRIGPVEEAQAKVIMQKATALGYVPQLVH